MLRPACLTLTLFLVPASSHALDITTCGQRIGPKEVGVLVADLDCSAQGGTCRQCTEQGCTFANPCTSDDDCADGFACDFGDAVTIENRGTFDLAGHAISRPNHRVISCAGRRCTVLSSSGRGDITGGYCVMAYKTRLAISDVDVHDCISGIESPTIDAKITATNVTSNRNLGTGIRAGFLTATNVTANDNGVRGVSAERGWLRGSNITVQNNGWDGAQSTRAFELVNFTATGNGTAGLEGTGMGLWGQGGGSLTDSNLTGNTYHDASGPLAIDLIVARRPRLVNTVCGSSGPPLLEGWGVCTND